MGVAEGVRRPRLPGSGPPALVAAESAGPGHAVLSQSAPRPSSLQEFVKDAGSYSRRLVDDLLDQITGGDHSRVLFQLTQVGCAQRLSRGGPAAGPAGKRGRLGDPEPFFPLWLFTLRFPFNRQSSLRETRESPLIRHVPGIAGLSPVFFVPEFSPAVLSLVLKNLL